MISKFIDASDTYIYLEHNMKNVIEDDKEKAIQLKKCILSNINIRCKVTITAIETYLTVYGYNYLSKRYMPSDKIRFKRE